MDALDKLKDAWKAQDYSKDKVATADIYKMLHAKSSSYVKWIFYISIIEFVLMNSVYFISDVQKEMDFYNQIGLENTIRIITVISTLVVFWFMYRFYKNYKNIKVDTSAKSLMDSILRTRKTVKQYIYFNLGLGALLTGYIFTTVFSNPEYFNLFKIKSGIQNTDNMSDTGILIGFIIGMLIMFLLILLFYRVVYGILLRRLKRNYKELAQLDK